MNRTGIPEVRPINEKEKVMLQMLADGKSMGEVGRHFHITKTRVGQYLDRLCWSRLPSESYEDLDPKTMNTKVARIIALIRWAIRNGVIEA